MAYTKSSKFAVKFCAKSPFNKGEKKNPEEPIDGGTLDAAEVVEYTGTPSEIRKKRRKHEGIGANWRLWKEKRNKRLNKKRVDRSSELDTNPLS